MLSGAFVAANAQNAAKAPVTHANPKGDPSFQGTPGWGNPPAAAAKLIFYGGDTNVTDPNEDSLANGNSLFVPNTTTYGAVTAPTGTKTIATGILFNQIYDCNNAPCSGTVFDPTTGTYDIRVGVSQGTGGTSVVNGSGPQTVAPTGRIVPFFGGVTEYAVSVNFVKPLTPTAGVTYYVNESPQCTDANNDNCDEAQFFVDNTTQKTNGINTSLQPAWHMFFNSAYFGFSWVNWCDPTLGTTSQACKYLSFGIYGTS